MKYINVAGEIYDSLVNGPGVRYVIFFQGCLRKCLGCHNEHTWKLGAGVDMKVEEIISHIDRSIFINGVTISGGEPFLQSPALYELCKAIREKFPKLTIMLYTGFDIEGLQRLENPYIEPVLELIDYLAVGEYQYDNPTTKKYVGSDNQKIIDIKKGKEIIFNE